MFSNVETQDTKHVPSSDHDTRQSVLEHFAKTLVMKPLAFNCQGDISQTDSDQDLKMGTEQNPHVLDTSSSIGASDVCSGCGSTRIKTTCGSCCRSVLCHNVNCHTRTQHVQDCAILQMIDRRTELLRRNICLTGIWLYRVNQDSVSSSSPLSSPGLSHETAILGTPLDYSERKVVETSLGNDLAKAMAEQQLSIQLLKQWLYENHAPCILASVSNKPDGKKHVSFIPILLRSSAKDNDLAPSAENAVCGAFSTDKTCPLCRIPCIKCCYCTMTIACPRKRSPCHVPGQRSCRRDWTMLLQILANVQHYR